MTGLPPGIALGVDDNHVCVEDAGHRVHCLLLDRYAEDGTARHTRLPLPQELQLGKVRQFVAGGGHACTLGSTGSVRCWGEADDGQVDGHPSPRILPPTRVMGVDSISWLGASATATCSLATDRTLRCWGEMPGVTDPAARGAVHTVRSDVHHVALVDERLCAIVGPQRQLYCGGHATVDDGIRDPVAPMQIQQPVQIAGQALKDVQAVALGSAHLCILDGADRVMCSGDNKRGQLGTGDGRPRQGFVQVGLPRISALVAEGDETCGLGPGERWFCWGASTRFRPAPGGRACDAMATAALALGDAQPWLGAWEDGWMAPATWRDRPALVAAGRNSAGPEGDGGYGVANMPPGWLCTNQGKRCWAERPIAAAVDAKRHLPACNPQRRKRSGSQPAFPLVPIHEARIYAVATHDRDVGSCADQRFSAAELAICPGEVRERGARLEPAEAERLLRLLNTPSAYAGWTSSCYTPRHEVLFFDAEGEIAGRFRFCFECKTHSIDPPLPRRSGGTFRHYRYLAELCREYGLPACPEADVGVSE